MENLRHFLADQEVVLGAQDSMSSEPKVLKSQRNELQVIQTSRYSKTCLKRPLTNRQNKGLKDN